MSATGLEVFDKTIHSTHTWLNEIGETIGPDKQRCYHALRAVLTSLRDRLTIEQSAHLAAELPLLVRGIYYEGFRPADLPLPLRSQDQFVTLVASRFGNIGPVNPHASTIAVFRVLQRHLPRPMVEKVKDALPKEIRALFQDEAHDASPDTHRDVARSRASQSHADQSRTAQNRPVAGDSVTRDWGPAPSAQEDGSPIRSDKLP